MTQGKTQNEKQAFVLRAIEAVKQVNAADGHPERKGMHVVYSGFNAEFVRRFNEPSMDTTDAMVAQGLIVMRPGRGGPTLYVKTDAPAASQSEKSKAALARI